MQQFTLKLGIAILAIMSTCLLISEKCQSQTCTIKGVVTYFFNSYQGDKADLGAEVWILDSSQAKSYNNSLSDTFYYGNFYRNLYSHSKSDDIKDEIKTWGVEKEDDFKKLDEREMDNLFVLENVESAKKTTVDGVGNFSYQVSPGIYYISIRSKNRQDISLTEVTGKVYFKKIKIKNGEMIDVSHNFGLY